jgi:hypothetical protein
MVRVPETARSPSRSAALELVQLGHEQAGVDHAPGADDAELPGEDPGRNVVERERLAVADDRVTGVRPALVAADDVRVQSEEVDDLPLALVAPLGAHDHGGRHLSESLRPQGDVEGRKNLSAQSGQTMHRAGGTAATGAGACGRSASGAPLHAAAAAVTTTKNTSGAHARRVIWSL